MGAHSFTVILTTNSFFLHIPEYEILMALIGTPATVPFWHVINGNALSLRSIEVSLASTSRDFGPANPSTVVLSVELMNSTLLPHLKACSSIHLKQ